MSECRKDDKRWCYLHPQEMVIGICALCLNDRLLVLAAAKQGTIHHRQTHKNSSSTSKRALTKIFALTSLLSLLEIKKQKTDQDYHSSSTSPEESADCIAMFSDEVHYAFISIKFEDNGIASWDKGSKVSKQVSSFDQQCEVPCRREKGNINAKKIKSVLEHSKPRAAAAVRWRRRVGHLLRLIFRLKNSTKSQI
ncbi:hypothetical protein OROHE_023640 [Orobanche hederae]